MKTRRNAGSVGVVRRIDAARCAAVLAVSAGLSAPALGQFRDWQTGSGQWSNNFSWFPIGVPLPGDIARIGFHAGAANSTVTLDGSDTVGGLQVTDGMRLDMGGSQLVVNGATLISGSNSPGKSYYRSEVRVEPGLAASELHAQNVTVDLDGLLRITGGAVARIDGELTVGTEGQLQGAGAVNFTSDGVRALNNNGRVQVWELGDLTFNQQGDARFDLDGTAGTGWVLVNMLADYTMTVNGTSLTDSFSGTISLAGGCGLVMNLDDPWEADAGSDINAYNSGSQFPQGMRLAGAPVTLSGSVDVIGPASTLFRVLADATINPTATIEVTQNDTIRFEGEADVNGGTFSAGQGGIIHFMGPTIMDGGTFQTPSTDFADGGVLFAGPTQWTGAVTIDGAARHNGNAQISSATTINAGELDMDGGGGAAPSTWNINHDLTINTQFVDEDGSGADAGAFDGTMNIAGGFAGRLTLNTVAPSSYWWMRGTMNLTGDPVWYLERVAGSRMMVNGDLNVVSGRVAVNADLRIYPTAHVTIGPASAVLRSGAQSVIYPATYSGFGTLQNGVNGDMWLSSDVDLDQIGLVNHGWLSLAFASATLISVDRFQQSADGEMIVDVLGTTPGVEHDLLTVTDGAASLDGQLHVGLNPSFLPMVGDEFVIITASGGVNGTFDNNPVSVVDDLTFFWAVDYNPLNVTLRVASVVPQCWGDANGDGMVNGADLSVVLAQFGQSVARWSGGDLNGDGLVDGADLSILLARFNNVCAGL